MTCRRDLPVNDLHLYNVSSQRRISCYVDILVLTLFERDIIDNYMTNLTKHEFEVNKSLTNWVNRQLIACDTLR